MIELIDCIVTLCRLTVENVKMILEKYRLISSSIQEALY